MSEEEKADTAYKAKIDADIKMSLKYLNFTKRWGRKPQIMYVSEDILKCLATEIQPIKYSYYEALVVIDETLPVGTIIAGFLQ
jgi:hypothetical protein